MKVCRVYAYDTHDRKDLFQEILIAAWQSYPKYKGDAKFSTWLYKVAIYTAIAGLRKSKSFIKSTDPNELPQSTITLSYDASQDDQLSVLYKAIAQLNEIDKAIVMLYLEDKSYKEMEDIMGINEATLRVKVNRIKEKLKQIIKS